MCAKGTRYLMKIVPYMFKLIMNKRWILSECNNDISAHFNVEREGAETISTGSEFQHHTAR